MEWHPNKELLDKYFEGITTVEEENKLKKYFLSGTISEDMKPYQPLFSFLKKEKEITYDKEIAIPQNKSRKSQFLKIAATFLIPVSMYVGYQKYQEYKAEQVYQTSLKALMLLSSNLQKGNDAIAELQEFENVKNKIFTYKNK